MLTCVCIFLTNSDEKEENELQRCSSFSSGDLCKKRLNASNDLLVGRVRKEVFLEFLAGKCAENKLAIKVLKDVAEVVVCDLLYLIENSLVSLLGNGSLTGITLSPLLNEELFENILKVELRAPAPAFSEGVIKNNLCTCIATDI